MSHILLFFMHIRYACYASLCATNNINNLCLSVTHLNGQGPIPKTQHVHDQQMFLLLTNHKVNSYKEQKIIVTIQNNYFKATAK